MLGNEGILDVSLLAFVIEQWNLPRNHPCSSALMVHPALSLRPNEIMRVIGESTVIGNTATADLGPIGTYRQCRSVI